jgi:tetratricopeptide (TPR) repeat protein
MTDLRPWICWLWISLLTVVSGDSKATLGEAEATTRGVNAREAVSGDLKSSDRATEDRELRKEQLQAARELYEAFPRGDAMFVLATVYNEQGDGDSALRHWEETTRLDDSEIRLYDRAAAYAGMGKVLHAKGDKEQAEVMLREALRAKPRLTETWLELGRLLYSQGKLEECLHSLDEGKAASPEALLLRGQALQRLGRFEEAKRFYEKAVQIKPDLAEGFYGLATICARLGDEAKASEHRAAFLKLKSEQQSAGRELRMGLNPLQTTKESLAQTHTQVGWVYELRGKPELAERIWTRAREIDPKNTAVRFHLVMLYQKSGRKQEALPIAKEMVSSEPGVFTHWITLANLYNRVGQIPEAEECYRKALSLAPDRPEPPFALAQFLLQRNTRLPEALSLAHAAVKCAPTAPHFFVLARSHAKLSQSAEALAAADKACALDPGNRQFEAFRSSLKPRP